MKPLSELYWRLLKESYPGNPILVKKADLPRDIETLSKAYTTVNNTLEWNDKGDALELWLRGPE